MAFGTVGRWLAIALMLVGMGALAWRWVPERAAAAGPLACAGCHAAQAQAWQGSHHAHAMNAATAASVLGDFGNVDVADTGGTIRMLRDAGGFHVRQGAAVYDVAYTFGVYPLQQYLIPFPGGRLQVFALAWDARPRAEGGQRWFRPLASVHFGDPLHWTGPAMNWNFSCAACHSTGVRKNYEAATNSYATRFAEVNVACTACHGSSAAHVAWATGSTRRATDGARGFLRQLDAARVPRFGFSAAAQRTASPRDTQGAAALTDLCAPCHARREPLVDDPAPGDAFLDNYRPALLTAPLFQPDGQNEGEVFEYAAFLQSRMAQAGVTCVNCHDPHNLSVRAPGNGVCGQCHRPAVFDVVAHTHHAADTPGSRCVACHMPARIFMGVHVRHDHGFRLPRPELADIGVANGCAGCHADRPAGWVRAALARWGARVRPTGFADGFAAARDGAPADRRLAAALADAALPGIVRGTAASLLAAPSEAVLAGAAGDRDPLVRLGVARALGNADGATRAVIGGALLADPLRAVRVEAAQSLGVATAEARGALLVSRDRPEALVAAGDLAARGGDGAGAMAAYRRAIELAPWFAAARVNLADAQRVEGDEAAARATLVGAVRVAPADPAPLEALVLAQVRGGERAAALRTLSRLAAVAPEDAGAARLVALGDLDANRPGEAAAALRRGLAARPRDAVLLSLLARVARGSEAAARLAALVAADGVASR